MNTISVGKHGYGSIMHWIQFCATVTVKSVKMERWKVKPKEILNQNVLLIKPISILIVLTWGYHYPPKDLAS